MNSKTKSVPHAPDRESGEGPFNKLFIQGATMIDGTGAPPDGPVDILVEGNSIREVYVGGIPGSPPENARMIDANGMYVMPGFVDRHAHIGGVAQGVPAEYVYKLWMGHGVTTVRDPGSFNGVDWTLHEKNRSAKNEIVAPRIYAYSGIGNWDRGPIRTPQDARRFVLWAKEKGIDGFKIINRLDPPVIQAVIEEANKQKLGSTAHLSQTTVARANALDTARMGLGSLEHWYGLPEALFNDRTVQSFPDDYNYSNEYDRFSRAGRLWGQAAKPGSQKWNEVMNELLDLNFVLDPTLTIYEATRDLMKARSAEWHEDYTLPSLWEFYQPDPKSHGSFFFDWTTKDETEWKENFRLWMAFINEYKNRGGRVCTGSDSGFIYKTYGFGYIRELELLQEAGFHPLEVIRSATMYGAQTLAQSRGETAKVGVIRPNMLADLVLVEENPLHNFKTLYGTGVTKLNQETGKTEQVGGVKYTIKDGIVYDAKQLLDDVKEMVKSKKNK